MAAEGGKLPSPPSRIHYKVYHEGGSEEISLDYTNAENGWNKLAHITYSRHLESCSFKFLRRTGRNWRRNKWVRQNKREKEKGEEKSKIRA